ncbi:FKBP-type peptidyl-prolyl cis-trans isomerase [Alkaliflexus imshenetskii]|uniref:FKBP-type peptidyl-prolyl cis-trans isomerase n=1 Tax=Alkaliflexus imshenetskii TaxID=286730 RepID=UPI0021CD7122|nr:FKBP-type peptidyl-prolyl cis-trans isomerase [Alkaliflexus imshenetskii]
MRALRRCEALALFTEMANREKKQRSKGSAGNNRKSGEDFLEMNAKKEGVIETESGLQYMVVEQTDGAKPDEWSTVEIHQRALLLNGTLLEDTYRLNQTSTVAMNELIEGLQEGLQLMSAGSRYKFWVPAELAWGRKGTGNKIPPNAVLHFDIRLMSIR